MSTKIFLISMIGGILGACVWQLLMLRTNREVVSQSANIISARQLNLVDDQGRLRIQLGMSKQGPPGIWIMDSNGVARGIFGLYEDETAYIGLQDAHGLMVQLMRSFGPHEAPLHIFKNVGQDRMIMGMNPGNGREAFTMFYDQEGKRQNHFGNYEGP